MHRIIAVEADKDGLDIPNACNEGRLLALYAGGGIYLVDVDPERLAELATLAERLPAGERARLSAEYQRLRETVTERKPEPKETPD